MRSQIKMYCVKDVLATLTPDGILPLLENAPYFAKSPVRLENALIFLTMLNLRSLNLIKEKDEDLWSSIHFELIEEILVSNYASTILTKLKELGIIEINDHYFNGLFTKKYKITDKFIFEKSKARRLEKYQAIRKLFNIEKYFIKKFKNKIIKQILLNMRCIFIDKNAAIERTKELFRELINELIGKSSIELSKELPNKLAEDLSNELIEELINEITNKLSKESSNKLTKELKSIQSKMKSYLDKINTIDFNYCLSASISESNGRLFNCLVNLPRELRPYLHVINKKSGELIFNKIEFDGKNTQPILLCILMRNEGAEFDEEYYKLCLDGEIYDLIARETEQSRDWVKARFMDTLLFTRSNGESTIKMKKPNYENRQKQIFVRYFKQRFPIIYNWLLNKKRELAKIAYERIKEEKKRAELEKEKAEKAGNNAQKQKQKRGGKKSNLRNLGGSDLAITIQTMESELWIQGLLEAVIEQFGDKYIYYTIHDSIVVFAPGEDIKKFIMEKFTELSINLYGVRMPLKPKEFNLGDNKNGNERKAA